MEIFTAVAKLLAETLDRVFAIQRELLEQIDSAKATELNLFSNFGETEATLAELEQLQNVAERLRNPYIRFQRILLLIAESQPTVDRATLELLERSLEDAMATVEAAQATTREIKQNWSLS